MVPFPITFPVVTYRLAVVCLLCYVAMTQLIGGVDGYWQTGTHQ